MKVNGDYLTTNGSYNWNDPQYICIHYTAGAWGVTAEANAIYYYNNGGSVQCGTHYFLGDDGVYQSTPEDRGAWTQGNYEANTHCISIEVACGSDEPCFTDVEIKLLRELVTDLMSRYNIDADHVIRHYDVVDYFGGSTVDPHKNCPRPYVDWDAWQKLKTYITGGSEDDMFDESTVSQLIWQEKLHNDGAQYGPDGKGSGNAYANVWNTTVWNYDNILDIKSKVTKANTNANNANTNAKNCLTKINTLATKVDNLQAAIDKLKINGASVDYEKLANLVCDKMSARMKE